MQLFLVSCWVHECFEHAQLQITVSAVAKQARQVRQWVIARWLAPALTTRNDKKQTILGRCPARGINFIYSIPSAARTAKSSFHLSSTTPMILLKPIALAITTNQKKNTMYCAEREMNLETTLAVSDTLKENTPALS